MAKRTERRLAAPPHSGGTVQLQMRRRGEELDDVAHWCRPVPSVPPKRPLCAAVCRAVPPLGCNSAFSLALVRYFEPEGRPAIDCPDLSRRRRVPWDNRGTTFQSPDFFVFADLRRLDAGSIPAASTKFSI